VVGGKKKQQKNSVSGRGWAWRKGAVKKERRRNTLSRSMHTIQVLVLKLSAKHYYYRIVPRLAPFYLHLGGEEDTIIKGNTLARVVEAREGGSSYHSM